MKQIIVRRKAIFPLTMAVA